MKRQAPVHPAIVQNPGLVSWPEASAYLKIYEAALKRGKGRLALFVLPQARTFASDSIERIAEYAVTQARIGNHVYLHMHLHDLPEGEGPKRGSLQTVTAAIGVFSDIDYVGPDRKKPAATLCGSMNDAVWILDQFLQKHAPLRFSVAIRSGFGIYPAILFREPLAIESPADRSRLERLGRRYHAALLKIATVKGWTGAVDYCDPAKVLRLPGSVNWKNPADPKSVSILWQTDVKLDPSDIEKILPETQEGAITSGPDKDDPPVRSTELIVDPLVEVPPIFIAALRGEHTKFGASWDHSRDDLKDQSCSGYDLALAAIGVGCGLTDQQICDLLVVHRREFPGRKQHRRGTAYLKYLRRTIDRARARKQSSETAEAEWAAFDAQAAAAEGQPEKAAPAGGDDSDTIVDEPSVNNASENPVPDQNSVSNLTTEAGGDNAARPGSGGETPGGTSTGDSTSSSVDSKDDVSEVSELTAGDCDSDSMPPAPSAEDTVPNPEFVPAASGESPAAEDELQNHSAGDGADQYPPGSSEPPPQFPSMVEWLISEVKNTGGVGLIYKHIDILAALPDSQLVVAYGALSTVLGLKLPRDVFQVLIKKARSDLHRQIYREHYGGIGRIKVAKDGTETMIPITNFTARITANIGEDDGVEVKRFFGIEAQLAYKPYKLIVPASKFGGMEWALEELGPTAIVYPNQKEWARAAIQSFSNRVIERRIYTHTGWRKVGSEMVYLHGGGAIGANGAVPDVDVRLSGALAHYSLLLPENRDELIEAVRASLRVLEVAPDHITCSALAAVYRACLKSCDFAVWLGGPTGVFKSELAALLQQHYGSAMNSRRLPGNFASTANALEMLAFSAKDSLLIIDDFAPHGGVQDINRYHAAADRILRAAGNNQGRGRLSSDARLREAKPPRGLILATGEDVPRGQSIRGRTLIIEVAPGDVSTTVLTECQAAAAEGMYARALGGFVKWIAGQYEKVQAAFKARVLELRSRATKVHSRTPGIVADLQAGFELLLEFAADIEAITPEEKTALQERCWTALNQVARSQRVQQDASEPTRRFLELLRAAILSGQAHLASLKGEAPGSDGQWGWYLVGSGDHERLVSRGKCIGWLDGPDLYLEPTASYSVAQELGRTTGEPLVVGQTTLKKRLKEKGLLASTDTARETLTIRRRVCGESVPVIHLHVTALSAPHEGGFEKDAAIDDPVESFAC